VLYIGFNRADFAIDGGAGAFSQLGG